MATAMGTRVWGDGLAPQHAVRAHAVAAAPPWSLRAREIHPNAAGLVPITVNGAVVHVSQAELDQYLASQNGQLLHQTSSGRGLATPTQPPTPTPAPSPPAAESTSATATTSQQRDSSTQLVAQPQQQEAEDLTRDHAATDAQGDGTGTESVTS